MTVTRNRRRVFLITFTGFVLALQAMCVFASGREGEAYVGAVLVIVAVVLIAFAASMIAGVVSGVAKARRSGESALKGGAFGVLKGLLYFLIVSAVTTVVVTFLGFLWIVYAFVVT